MSPEEYISGRLDEQYQWYSSKSRTNKMIFLWLRIAEIAAAALIPFLSGLLINMDNYKTTGIIIIGVLGMLVTVIAGVLSLGRYQENWIEFRKTSESLKREKFLYETQVEPYNADNRFNLLVQTVESMLAKENTDWAQNMFKAQADTTIVKKIV